MSFDPVQRILRVEQHAEPSELLGLQPETDHSAFAIDESLRRRLGEVYNHPDGRSEDAEVVRRALREAAAILKARGAARARPSARVQPQTLVRPQRSGPPLTAFDRSVLSILVGSGGWNAVSRARLIALAATHGVTSQGLLKVITGLGQYARTGPRFGVAQIIDRPNGTASRAVGNSVVAAIGAADSGRGDSLNGDNAAAEPSSASDPHRETIRLSLFYGFLALLLAVFAVAQFSPRPFPGFGRHARTAPVPQQIAVAPALEDVQAEKAGEFEELPRRPEPPARWKPLQFTATPTFSERIPEAALQARAACETAADDLDQIARTLTVNARAGENPSEMTFRTWEHVLENVARCWVLLDDTTLRSIERGVMDVLFAAPRAARDESAEAHARLLRALSPPALDATPDPLDAWRGAWNVGMLARIAFHPDLPAEAVDVARAKLNVGIGRRAGDDVRVSFAQAAATWLSRAVPSLIEPLDDPPRGYLMWELWVAVQKRVGAAGGDSERFNGTLVSAIKAILLTHPVLVAEDGLPTARLKVIGRLLEESDYSTSARVHDGLLALFDDIENIRAKDLWILTSVLAHTPRAAWFDESFILLTSEPGVRQRLRQDIANAWPASALVHRRAARRSPVDPVSGERWLRLAERVENEAIALDREDALLRQVIRAARMGEAAAYLAVHTPARADRLMNAIERALAGESTGAADERQRRAPARPAGTEGGWAAAYAEAGRDVEARVRLLRTLRSTAGEDLHPADAAVLVREVYRGTLAEIRTEAMSLVVDVFARGPNVAREMLDQFPEAQRTPALSEALSRFTRQSLPAGPGRDLNWTIAARLALIEHLLLLLHEAGPLVEQLADELGASYSNQAASLRGDDHGPMTETRPGAVPPLIGGAELFDVWRERTRIHAASRLGEDLDAFDRRHRFRIALSDGPVQETVAKRVATLELMAIATRAAEPELDRHIMQIIGNAAAERKVQPSALLQALTVERAIIAIWRLRLNVPEDVEIERPGGDDEEELARRGRSSHGGPGVNAGVLMRVLLLNPTASVRRSAGTVRWNERIEGLNPSRPMEYYELAEEIVDESGIAASVALAKHLFALAGALDPALLGRSACLALASLEEAPHLRQRLLLLADLLERGDTRERYRDEAAGAETLESQAAGLALSEAFSFYRQGQGSRALQVLGRDEVMKRLESVESALPWRSAQALVIECTGLRGRRPSVSKGLLVRMIQIEQYLLGGDRNWAMELAFNHGRPLIEIDPQRLDEALGVDANRPYYRAGRWVARP